MARLRTPKAPKRRKGFVTREQYESILAICSVNDFLGARRQVMFRLLKSSGIRLNEMVLLRLDDLDWDASRIRVIYGKGQKERYVPFNRDVQLAAMKYGRLRSDDHGCLWVSEEREPMGYNAVYRDVRRMMQRAGVEVKDAVHVWRRSWAANAVRSGIPRPYVQAIAGWSTPTMMDNTLRPCRAKNRRWRRSGTSILGRSQNDLEPLPKLGNSQSGLRRSSSGSRAGSGREPAPARWAGSRRSS